MVAPALAHSRYHFPMQRQSSSHNRENGRRAAPTGCALVCVRSADEVEYARLRVALDVRRRRMGELEAAVAPLQRAFERFEQTYNARLEPAQHALREVEAEIAQCESRIARIHARIVADPEGVLGDLFSRDELRDIGTMFDVDASAWQEWQEWHDRQETMTARHEREHPHEWHRRERLRSERFEPRRRRLSASDETELRARYRALARRFHPDLARSDEERQIRQEMMHRINAAWHARDLGALRALAQEAERAGLDWEERPLASRLAWTRRECVRLDGVIGGLAERLASLRASATLPLWMNPSLAETVIAQRLAHLASELDRARERLDATKHAFRQALAAFALDRDVA